MTYSDDVPRSAGSASAAARGQAAAEGAEVVLSEERLVAGVRQVPIRKVRIAKRIVTEQQTVTVQVRREELVVEEIGLDDAAAGADAAGAESMSGAQNPVAPGEPLVLVLSREVPDQVLLRAEPVEVVRVHVDRITQQQPVRASLRREEVDVEQYPAR